MSLWLTENKESESESAFSRMGDVLNHCTVEILDGKRYLEFYQYKKENIKTYTYLG
jgi:hypothetical protein